MRSRLMVAAAMTLVVAAVAAVAGGIWWLQHHSSTADAFPRVRFDQSSHFGIAVPYSNDKPWLFGSIPVCLTKPGVATITSIEPVGGNGQLKVIDEATRVASNRMFGDSQQASLSDVGFTSPALVSTPCHAMTELGVQVENTGTGDGTWTSVRIHYLSDGHTGTEAVPWALKLCGQRTSDASCAS